MRMKKIIQVKVAGQDDEFVPDGIHLPRKARRFGNSKVCLNSALKETSKDLEQLQVERKPAKYKQDDKSCAFPFSV